MEKSDRDFTHAKRAEDEYRNLIMQYPDNPKLVKEGKLRLLEVQEVLGDREFNIGKFYFLRQSYNASIARLQSLVDKYPLYSHADEALFLLGQNYEAEIANLRAKPICKAVNTPPGCVGGETAVSYTHLTSFNRCAAGSLPLSSFPAGRRPTETNARGRSGGRGRHAFTHGPVSYTHLPRRKAPIPAVAVQDTSSDSRGHLRLRKHWPVLQI